MLEQVERLGANLVELTGGEPLLQPALPTLARLLLEGGHQVLVETGGHRDISVLDPRVHVILDLKTPGSGMEDTGDPENLRRLRPGDELKIVLADRSDYDWARGRLDELSLPEAIPVQLSPVHGQLDPRELAKWILDDQLPVRLNLQLHKYIWGPDAKSV